MKTEPLLKSTDTIMNNFFPGSFLGSISQKVYNNVQKFIAQEKTKEYNLFNKNNDLNVGKYKLMQNIKYLNCLAHPGEAVGVVAA